MREPLLFSTSNSPPIADPQTVGGKAARLWELARDYAAIPRFMVIQSDWFEEFLADAGLGDWLAESLATLPTTPHDRVEAIAARVQARLLQTELPVAMCQSLEQAQREFFSPGTPLAVRSSIVGEDSTEHSFAGIHDSILGVRTSAELWQAVRSVWASAFSSRALLYRRHRGLAEAAIRPAVIVQELVPAVSSGVAFSRHPLAAQREQVLIQSTWGLGTDIVGGSVTGDTFLVDRQTLQITPELTAKDRELIYDMSLGNLESRETPRERRNQSSLTDDQIVDLAELAIRLEQRFGRAQDLEFCCDQAGNTWLLQARDLTASSAPEAVRENHLVWDNSNIAESYSGITLPLTFSFIRRVYAIVYHCFAEVMGVSPQVIQTNRRVYENLLGSIEGRVYYNLKSWYRALSLLPGFGYNRRFLETMMGVSQSLALDERPRQTGWFGRWFFEFPALLRTLTRSLWTLSQVNRYTAQFQDNFQKHYAAWDQLDFAAMSPSQLHAQYERLEDALLWNWKAPIIGDFHLMIFYGLLKQFCDKWCGVPGLQTELLRGMGDLESAAPAHQLLELARQAASTPRLKELILRGRDQDLLESVAAEPVFSEFQRNFRTYVERYGFRCPEELKLESPSLRDEPERLFAILRNYLKLEKPDLYDSSAIRQRDLAARAAAELRAERALSQLPRWFPRKTIFRWVLNQARSGVRNRENMRFSRTRIFGLIRKMFRSVGNSFAKSGHLNSADDIFYLTAEEVWDYVKGTAVTTDLRGIVNIRHREYAGYRSQPIPPDNRFETFGVVYDRNSFRSVAKPAGDANHTRLLAGLGSCAGIVTGKVVCLENPRDFKEVRGAILAGRRMDAGWVTLFPLVQGVLVEHGNLLSHAAVVAREMGLPTIVSIPGLMSRLENGMTVRMDGQAGTVEVLST
ncbi:MAG: PEP/pyruvate-binding domain-containing protein [Planctomycetota bacterium]